MPYDELNKLPCSVTLFKVTQRSKGKQVSWWFEYLIKFPDLDLPSFFETRYKFKNKKQAYKNALKTVKYIIKYSDTPV